MPADRPRAWQYMGDPAFAPSLHEDRTPCLLYIAAEPLTPDDIPLAPPVEVTAADGAALIAAERRRQVEAEGWTPEHDDEHARGELAEAAICYARAAEAVVSTLHYGRTRARRDHLHYIDDVQAADAYVAEIIGDPLGYHYGRDDAGRVKAPTGWPWEPEVWKPDLDPVRNLIKAGALIAAEIDRLGRLAVRQEGEQ